MNVHEKTCANCNKADAKYSCKPCLSVKYCSKECQIAHWKEHKPSCLMQRKERDIERGGLQLSQRHADSVPSVFKSEEGTQLKQELKEQLGPLANQVQMRGDPSSFAVWLAGAAHRNSMAAKVFDKAFQTIKQELACHKDPTPCDHSQCSICRCVGDSVSPCLMCGSSRFDFSKVGSQGASFQLISRHVLQPQQNDGDIIVHMWVALFCSNKCANDYGRKLKSTEHDPLVVINLHISSPRSGITGGDVSWFGTTTHSSFSV
jgi:hypothetical protein